MLALSPSLCLRKWCIEKDSLKRMDLFWNWNSKIDAEGKVLI